VLRKGNIQFALKLHLQERNISCVEEGEHTVCIEVAPAGTYINCVEEGEHTFCIEVAPAGT
jgi:hypothetical protein